MKLTRTLRSHDRSTTIEARLIAPDLVEIRYIKPIPCNWINRVGCITWLGGCGSLPGREYSKQQ